MTTITYTGGPKAKRRRDDILVADMIRTALVLCTNSTRHRQSIDGIWIQLENGKLRVSATDSFMLGHLTVDRPDNCIGSGSVFVPTPLAKQMTAGPKPWSLVWEGFGGEHDDHQVTLGKDGMKTTATVDAYTLKNIPRPIRNGDFTGLPIEEKHWTDPVPRDAPAVTFGTLAKSIAKLAAIADPVAIRHSNSDGLKPMLVEIPSLPFQHRIIAMPVRLNN